jgi:nicotinamidase-related amidase
MENNIKGLYHEFEDETLIKGRVALLCIDIQYHDAAPGYGFFSNTTEKDPEYAYYFRRLKEKVFPTVSKLQNLFREQGQEIIHVRIEALTRDGRDRSLEHKRIGCLVPKGSKAAEFIKEVAPKDDEIVISKTASGVFNSTNLDYVLKNLGVNQLIVVGVLTNECIETAVRDGGDKSYSMYVVEEGVAALNEELHKNSLKVLDGVYGKIISFDQAKEMIQKIAE